MNAVFTTYLEWVVQPSSFFVVKMEVSNICLQYCDEESCRYYMKNNEVYKSLSD